MNATSDLIGYSPSQIECMARELFKHRQDVKCVAPIRLEFLIENMADVQLEIVMGLRHRHGVEGGIWKEARTRQLTVFVDWGIGIGPWPEYNAVLGEEFAHLMLHQSLLIQVQSVEDFLELQRDPEWERYERDARRYSRAVRMPAVLFVDEAESLYAQIVAEHSFGDADMIEKLVINGLCQKFRVPADDARRRMLSYPCDLSRRIVYSVATYSPILIPADSTLTTARAIQRKLNGFNLD